MQEAPFSADLLETNARITVEKLYSSLITNIANSNVATSRLDANQDDRRMQTPTAAKDIREFSLLVKQAIENAQTREKARQLVNFSYEAPNSTTELERITFAVVERDPGGFDQGSPMKQEVRNLRPILREEIEDPNAPGYRLAILGKHFDHIVRLICWAKVSWQAFDRMLWLENVMDNYAWWFTSQGINRVIYWGSKGEIVLTVNDNKIYGRPVDYFVRTEKLQTVSTKTMTELVIQLGIQKA